MDVIIYFIAFVYVRKGKWILYTTLEDTITINFIMDVG